jgi:hypothetical protein
LHHHLIGVDFWPRIAPNQAVDTLSVHEIGANEAGESERAFDDLLRGLSHAQKQESDEGGGNLDADGVFTVAQEMSDF